MTLHDKIAIEMAGGPLEKLSIDERTAFRVSAEWHLLETAALRAQLEAAQIREKKLIEKLDYFRSALCSASERLSRYKMNPEDLAETSRKQANNL